MDSITINSNKIYCSLIVKDGFIVRECYGGGFTKSTKGNIFSVTKSFLSALIGIAIEKGYLGLQDAVSDYFHEFVSGPQEWFKDDITVENLLTMTSGIFCPTNAGFNRRMSQSDDELHMLLRLPVNRKNMGKFIYNDANYNLLSNILHQATQKTPLEFANKVLFAKMGIGNEAGGMNKLEWEADAKGVNYGGFGLKLSGRDMAKFGYLYIKQGIWNGQSLVPKEWIDLSTAMKVLTTEKELYYGYGWWNCEVYGLKTYYAIGAGGQYIICTPQLDLIQVYLCEKNSMASKEVEQVWKETIKDFKEQKVDHGIYKSKECIFT